VRTAKRTSYKARLQIVENETTVTLPAFAIERLHRHRLEQEKRFLSSETGRPGPETLLFERNGLPWNPNSFGAAFARIVRDAKLPKVRLDDLRHSFASLLLAGRADPKPLARRSDIARLA